MTRDEFIAYWRTNAGMASENFELQGWIALPCDCGASDCHGWQMTNIIMYQVDTEALLALPQEYQDEIKEMEERNEARNG